MRCRSEYRDKNYKSFLTNKDDDNNNNNNNNINNNNNYYYYYYYLSLLITCFCCLNLSGLLHFGLYN